MATITAEDIDNDSSDPDGDPITLALDATGPFGLGDTQVTLTVTDGSGESSNCTATVSVVDATAPIISVSATNGMLWPPNHNLELVDVGLIFQATDACDPDPDLGLGVTSDEPAEDQTGDGNHSPDARLLRDAEGDVNGLRIRAERKGNSDGRVYLIQLDAVDDSGNQAAACATVTVPKSQSAQHEADVLAQAAAAVAACPTPLPYNVLGPPPDGPAPEIGPKQ